ncbi:MAG: hypothetical protein CFE45_37180, partial [Burkholderiales bacterium PBB5]
QWARDRDYNYRRVRDAGGCVIDGRLGTMPWRIEWGAPQREYIQGGELRIIGECDLPKELMAMVLNRPLMESMEKTVYDRFVDDVQTRMDAETPAEMRWLVMFSKMTPQDLGRLGDRYGAVCSIPNWLPQWLHGPLNDALAATLDVASPDAPVVMPIGRGRLPLRVALPDPDLPRLLLWMSVFEHALREARRLGTEWRDASGAGLSPQPSAWSQSDHTRGPGPTAGH